ncbi:hypothetical protein F2Q68_00009631 [Brassica cretica]|uniref:Uncharacterized protein n=1 Tax=Brassica cretica TaxID=69181 RepID=A0A8S9KWY0_BRACR|nr:hypothetical protein F2Q68_00009631 [Brassica cretica]
MDEDLRKDRYEKRQVKTREPDRSHLSVSAPRSPHPWARTTSTTVTSPMGEDDQHHGHLAHGTTSTTVTSPMGEDDKHHGHLAHGRGRQAPRSPRPWARTTSTTVTSPTGEDDQHHGHLAHGRG